MSSRPVLVVSIALSVALCSGCSRRPSPAAGGGAAPGAAASTPTAAGSSGASAAPAGGEDRARALLADMRKAYAALTTFREHAVIRSSMRSAGSDFPYLDFTKKTWTAFARPAHLHLEVHAQHPFKPEHELAILWISGKMSAEYGSHSVDAHMAAAAGVDLSDPWQRVVAGAVDLSPAAAWLLEERLPEGLRRTAAYLDDLTHRAMADDEEIDGAAVHKITARVDEDKIARFKRQAFAEASENARVQVDVALWIDRKTLLLRRLKRSVLVEDLGEIKSPIGSSFGITLPDLVIDVTCDVTHELNPDIDWRELDFTNPYALQSEDKSPQGYAGPGVKPTKKGRSDAKKEGRRIWAAALKAYAGASTYRDSGVIEWKAIDRTRPKHAAFIEYKTAFKRPASFRLEMRRRGVEDEWIDFVAWRRGDQVKTWTSEMVGIHPHQNLRDVFEEQIVYHGPNLYILNGLLFAEPPVVSPLASLRGPILLGTQKLDGATCHVIRGADANGLSAQLWIDANSSLIRRADTQGMAAGYPAWQSIRCKPIANKKISARSLALGVKED